MMAMSIWLWGLLIYAALVVAALVMVRVISNTNQPKQRMPSQPTERDELAERRARRNSHH
jgi:hypothetical protein